MKNIYKLTMSCIYSSKLLYELQNINKRGKQEIDIARVGKAINLARESHKTQTRKSGEPYYSHVIKVASLVSKYSSNTDLIVAAILHDTLEDTDLTLEELSKHTSPRISSLVFDLTRGNKKVKYYSALECINKCIQKDNRDAILIKLCDRADNLESIYALSIEKQYKILEESMYFLPAAKLIDQIDLGWRLYCSIIENKIRLGSIPADFAPLNNLRESFLKSLN